MKLKYKISLTALMLIILGSLILGPKEFKQALFQYFEGGKGEESTSVQNLTQSQTGQTSETNYSTNPPQEGGGGAGETTKEEGQAAKAITLEITDICSGKLDLFTISEGATKCLNRKYPYQIILEKNSTHLTTSFYGLSGFEESYELNETILLFFIFAEDVASVSHEIQSFSLEGSQDFSLGQYYLHTIWERDAAGNLVISKMIAILPLQVNGNIMSSDWKELKFYLNIPNKTYYLGNLWVLVKEK
ncbi:MAG: hypothetical protein QXU74_00105 [Candidatus Aenigmatarchaeota archaeon]